MKINVFNSAHYIYPDISIGGGENSTKPILSLGLWVSEQSQTNSLKVGWTQKQDFLWLVIGASKYDLCHLASLLCVPFDGG